MIHVILQKDISKNVCYKRIKHAKNVDGSMCKINNLTFADMCMNITH